MFVPHHQLVSGDNDPSAWMLCLHGVYGSGSNWRTFARRLIAARPDWGVALVDLRVHGKSNGAPPPHTLGAAAADLVALADLLNSQGRVVRAVCGHSLGGKIALQYRALAGDALDQCWVIDASPSASPGAFDAPDNTVVAVLRMLEQLPRRYESRDQFVAMVVERGFPAPLAQWLAMNVQSGDDGYQFGLDTAAVRDLLGDYYRTDLWSVVEAHDDIGVVVAGRGSAVSESDRVRYVASGAVVHVFEESGHWVHIDALDRLVEVVSGALGRDTPRVQ